MIKELFVARKYSFSRILAAAIIELLPGAQIARAGLSYHGFYCDFLYSPPLSGELLERLAEQMRQVIRESRDIRVLEMVPFSASEMLKKLGQRERSRQVLEQEGLVRLVRMGEFVDWCEEGLLSSTGGAGVFRLLSQTDLERGVYRVFGVSAESKQELKELSSKWARFDVADHEKVGSRHGLWFLSDEDRRLWLPRGLAVRGRWISYWLGALAPLAEPVEGGQEILEVLAEKIPSSMELVEVDDGEGSRGLLDQPVSKALIINHFLDSYAFCTSFLQTIHKSLTILGFAYRIRCFGKKRKGCPLRRSLEVLGWDLQEGDSEADPRLEFLVEDALRCEWVAAEISERKLKRFRGLSATVWVERNLALLIEKNDGSLPFWLAQENNGIDCCEREREN